MVVEEDDTARMVDTLEKLILGMPAGMFSR